MELIVLTSLVLLSSSSFTSVVDMSAIVNANQTSPAGTQTTPHQPASNSAPSASGNLSSNLNSAASTSATSSSNLNGPIFAKPNNSPLRFERPFSLFFSFSSSCSCFPVILYLLLVLEFRLLHQSQCMQLQLRLSHCIFLIRYFSRISNTIHTMIKPNYKISDRNKSRELCCIYTFLLTFCRNNCN